MKDLTLSRYKDEDPIYAVAIDAQRYYERHGFPTMIKACSLTSMEETLKLAGVAHMTLPLHWLQALKTSERSQAELLSLSLFSNEKVATRVEERISYIDDESGYRAAFAKVEGGKSERKTKQVSLRCPSIGICPFS